MIIIKTYHVLGPPPKGRKEVMGLFLLASMSSLNLAKKECMRKELIGIGDKLNIPLRIKLLRIRPNAFVHVQHGQCHSQIELHNKRYKSEPST